MCVHNAVYRIFRSSFFLKSKIPFGHNISVEVDPQKVEKGRENVAFYYIAFHIFKIYNSENSLRIK